MKTRTRLAVAGGLAAAAAGLFAGPAVAAPARPAHHSLAPVFVQNDNLAGNVVYAYDRDRDGSLRPAGHYSTGGNGGQLPDSVVDHLASQGSLTLDAAHRSLYAVNAGSNTVTAFGVRGDRLVRRQVVSTRGSFPVSVAARGNLVFVLNARSGGSIETYANLGGYLVPIASTPLGLSTTVPTGTPAFVLTPGQVTVTPDGRFVAVTTKANGNQIRLYPIGLAGRLGAPVVTSDVTGSTGNVPFAIAFDRSGAAIVAEAGANTVARFRLARDGSLSLTSRIATGGQATCWIAAAPGGNRFYVNNAGSATVTTVLSGRGTLANTATTAAGAGTTDGTVSSDGRNLYVQAGADGSVDEYAIGRGGALRHIGSVTVPGAVGGEGIAAA